VEKAGKRKTEWRSVKVRWVASMSGLREIGASSCGRKCRERKTGKRREQEGQRSGQEE